MPRPLALEANQVYFWKGGASDDFRLIRILHIGTVVRYGFIPNRYHPDSTAEPIILSGFIRDGETIARKVTDKLTRAQCPAAAYWNEILTTHTLPEQAYQLTPLHVPVQSIELDTYQTDQPAVSYTTFTAAERDVQNRAEALKPNGLTTIKITCHWPDNFAYATELSLASDNATTTTNIQNALLHEWRYYAGQAIAPHTALFIDEYLADVARHRAEYQALLDRYALADPL
jgi:hypothetical protein